MLKNKNILIGVTGSIAIYKSLELIRLFIKQNANVRVIMSEDAKRFITPLSFEAISQNKVLHVETESWANDNNHIHIGKWADILIIAPITANSINKLAHGVSDNLLTQIILAFNKQIIIAPAANTNMILNPITKNSLLELKKSGFIISEAQNKLLACLDEGVGAMSEPSDIYNLGLRELLKDSFWQNKHIVITGGGSIEKIDDVRCLSNLSSGKMANALAYAFYIKGANVVLITSKADKSLHVNTLHASSTDAYKQAIQNSLKKGSYLFMCAAISDFVPTNTYSGKLKKDTLGDNWDLKLKKNEDILLNLEKKDIKTIGFKAEIDINNALPNARSMLKQKSLDVVCLNILGKENNFGSEQNEVSFITKTNVEKLQLSSKLDIALKITELSKAI